MSAPARPNRSLKRPSTASPLLDQQQQMSRQQRMMVALAQDDSITLRPNVPAGAPRRDLLRRTDSVASTALSDQTDDLEEDEEEEEEEEAEVQTDKRATNDDHALLAGATPSDARERQAVEPVEQQQHQQRKKPTRMELDLADESGWPDTIPFKQVERVMRAVRQDWPMLLASTSASSTDSAADFDTVDLALHLLESKRDHDLFSSLKTALDESIGSLLDADYRAYETSISTYNATLQGLAHAQKHVESIRQSLSSSREGLNGAGKEALIGMWTRLKELEECEKLVEEIEGLRTIPDLLESLLSDKRFLSAVVLLVRSLRTIKKPEMIEIGGLADLRVWLVAQENVLLEMLVEELHNHLYLKSFYCDSRWKAYTRGQSTLPVVDFGDDATATVTTTTQGSGFNVVDPQFHASGRSNAALPRLSKLQRYLTNLAVRPQSNPLVDEPIIASSSAAAATASDMTTEEDGTTSKTSSKAIPSSSTTTASPESDSFAYIEMLLESLACLGKLGYALDAVSQRVQIEIYGIVERTVEEVDERNDIGKLSAFVRTSFNPYSLIVAGTSTSTSRIPSFFSSATTTNNTTISGSTTSGSNPTTGKLSFSSTPTTSLEVANVETLRDLFWTLYSKLDAVLQGFRVAYEVAQRIVDRHEFKERGLAKSSAVMFSLLEVWKPVQAEVRTLLQDYLTDDDHRSAKSTRNPIASVNEVLRSSTAEPGGSVASVVVRDGAQKQVFKFGESDAKSAQAALRLHEASLQKKLREALPGLSSDLIATTTTTTTTTTATTSSTAAGASSSGPLSSTGTGGAATGIISALGGTILLGGSSSSIMNSASAATTTAAADGTAAGIGGGSHKTLVRPDAFNVSVLFGPTLAFLERVRQVMPNLDDGSLVSATASSSGSAGQRSHSQSHSSNGTTPQQQQQQQQYQQQQQAKGATAGTSFAGFLDDFVRTTFLPQLEEKVSGVLSNAIGGNDAFAEDAAWRKYSTVPIVKSVPNLLRLLDSLCSMLRATPFHRDSYSHLIVSVIQEFYTRCSTRFADLVAPHHHHHHHHDHHQPIAADGSTTQSSTLAAVWSANEEMKNLLTELWELPSIDRAAIADNMKATAKLEDALRMGNNGSVRPVREDELIGSMRRTSALGVLYSSTEWFVERISSFKIAGSSSSAAAVLPNTAAAAAGGGGGGAQTTTSQSVLEEGDVFELPLTEEMTGPFAQLISSFRQLSTRILHTLRIEVRLVTMYRLDKATRDGSYYLLEPSIEPDDEIVRLNSVLADMDEVVASAVASKERRFVFYGIAQLMDTLLVANARFVRLANANGRDKMTRNILALQQNLKNIGEEPLEADFGRSRLFWSDVFAGGPEAMLGRLKAGQLREFDFDECKVLLNLMCGIDQSSKDQASSSSQAQQDQQQQRPRSSMYVANEKGRRVYDEYLIELLALDTSRDFEE